MFSQMQTSLAKNYIYLHTDTGEYCGKSNVRNGKNIQVHSVFEFDLNSWIARKRISQIEIIHISRSGSNGNNILVLVFWTWKIHRYLCMCLSVSLLLACILVLSSAIAFIYIQCMLQFSNTSWLITRPLRLMRKKLNSILFFMLFAVCCWIS